MSEYQVIARKWRPQRFSDVVGQEHIIQTLKNAIRMQRTAHAYLFVGPRGVGKTTTARIFAKALNCLSPEDGEPCCKCRSCLAVTAGNNIDVIEIDAASQSGVNDARAIREEALHVPIACRYKIYIIDEVHMLSKPAWNALLKIVEEPPPHIKFIFATTEVHMVLGTIISRCQRFDLQRISMPIIIDRLEKICQTENVKISREAILAIARAADGGMRDAQSLLDQMIAFFCSEDNPEITEGQALSLFGLSGDAEIDNLIIAMCTNDRSGVVSTIYTLASNGKNLETLFSDILARLRGVQLCYLLENPGQILETDAEAINAMRRICEQTNLEIIQILMEQLSPVGRALHDALNKQVFLESIFLKAMREAHAVKIEDLLSRLNQLRNAGELQFVEKIPAVSVPEVKPVPLPASIQKPEPKQETKQEIKPEPKPEPEPEIKPEAKSEIKSEVKVEVKPEPELKPKSIVKTKEKSKPEPNPEPIPVPAAEAFSAPTVAELTPEALWSRITEEFSANHELSVAMRQCSVNLFKDDILVVVFEDQTNAQGWQLLGESLNDCHLALQKLTGRPLASISLRHVSDSGDSKEQGTRIKESLISDFDALEKARNNETVKTTIDLFGGEIAEITK